MHWGSIKLAQAAQMVLERERSGTEGGLVGLGRGWACIGVQLISSSSSNGARKRAQWD